MEPLDDVERLSLELSDLPASARPAFMQTQASLLLRPETLQSLSEKVAVALRSDVPQALRFAEAWESIARELGDRFETALALRAQANALALINRHTASVELFGRATEIFQELGRADEVGRTSSSLLQPLLLLGRYEEAFAAAERGRTIFEELGETRRLARLAINVANIYHRQNRMAEALSSYEDAYVQLLPLNDFEGITVAIHNAAVCRIALDDLDGALRTYDRLRALEAGTGLPMLAAQADYNSAYLYFLRGEYTRALRLLSTSRELYREQGDEYHQALCDMDQSEIYLELGMSEDAAVLASAGLARFERLGTRHEIARSLADLGIALEQDGDNVRASEYFARAKEIFRLENNRLWPALLDLYGGIAAYHAGHLADARRLGLAACRSFRLEEAPGKFLQSLLLLTRVVTSQRKIQRARRFIQFVLCESDQLAIPALIFEAQFLHGEIEDLAGNRETAYSAYLRARQTLEVLRGDLRTEELKVSLMKSRVEVYERLAAICLERPQCGPADVAEAFSYLEESRSRTLRDLVSGGGQESPHQDSGGSVKGLRDELNRQYRRMEREQLSREGLAPEIAQVMRERVRVLERKLLEVSREREYEAGQAASSGSRPVTLAEMRRRLPPESVLIQYFSLRNRLFAICISRDRVETVPVDTSMEIGRRVRLLQLQMGKLRLGSSYEQRFRPTLIEGTNAHLKVMYSALIGPLEELIAGKQHLVIVPSGALHGLPFHAFFDGSQYLIDRFTVSYAPSASMFAMRPPTTEADRSKPPLIVGVTSNDTPHVEEEARAVAQVIPGARMLLGNEATLDALQERGRASRLIHIATHGIFRADHPMFSSIRMADGYLSLFDLYHLSLPADLLTLSGCGTGMNVITAGDEQLGLARGLLFAGARALLLSLWEVDDQSTSKFMQDFYLRLSAGGSKAASLARAMHTLRAEYPHPYHWAPFKLIGTADTVLSS